MSTRNSNGFWPGFDTWGKRALLIVAIVVLIGGGFAAWANFDSRIAAVEHRVDRIERLIEEKIDPMRDDVLILRTDVQSIKDDVAELKRRQ